MSKFVSGFITLGLVIAVIYLPCDVYGYAIHVGTAPLAMQDSKKIKHDLYETFEKNRAGDAIALKTAYEAGKEYLQKFPDEKDPHVKEIREWIALYGLAKVYKEKKYDEAFEAGKYVLSSDAENIRILTALGYAGMQSAAAGNGEFIADATVHAKKAIQLIESGKTPVDWKPFAGKDETLGWLNYSIGVMVLKAPGDASGFLVKAAQYEGAPKNNPVLYYYLASSYSQTFEKERSDYKAKYEGKEETPESKAALEKVGATVDLIIDAYARAIAYVNVNPQYQQGFQLQQTEWTTKLTELYKSRHNSSDAGLKEMIADIRTKPLPGRGLRLTTSSLP